MMYRITVYVGIILLVGAGLCSAQEELTITTYYPSPHGVYDQLLTNEFAVGDMNEDGSLTEADLPPNPGDLCILGNLGVGTSTPGAKLDVEVSDVSPGGAATIGSSTNSAIGAYAVAMGHDTVASGNYSFAVGNDAEASGYSSIAMGRTEYGLPGPTASGYGSIALGSYTTASGSRAIAMGRGSIASGGDAIAIGLNANATGATSIAIGWHTDAGGTYGALTMGTDIRASQDYSMIIGKGVAHDNRLVNNTANSLMVGFNSNIPTLFVGPSSGAGTTGNVGIGTTNPQTKLHIAVPDLIGGNAVIFEREDGGRVALQLRAGEFSIYNQGHGSNMAFVTEQSDGTINDKQLFLNANGNVGIGTVYPQEKLDIVGAARVQGWDAVYKSFDPTDAVNRAFHLIGTYHGWDPEAIYIAGYNFYNPAGGNVNNSYAKRIHFGNPARMTVDLETGKITGKILGDWQGAPGSAVRQAPSDGFVIATIAASAAGNYGWTTGKTDSANPPTIVRASASANYDAHITRSSFTMPVKKDDYWKLDWSLNGSDIVVHCWWISLGD